MNAETEMQTSDGLGADPDPLAQLAADVGYSDDTDDPNQGSMEALIDYKNALEDRCRQLEGLLAAIAGKLPTDDEWRPAADFTEAVASMLDAHAIERPEHYSD